jgi:hypothetical protein
MPFGPAPGDGARSAGNPTPRDLERCNFKRARASSPGAAHENGVPALRDARDPEVWEESLGRMSGPTEIKYLELPISLTGPTSPKPKVTLLDHATRPTHPSDL